VGLKTLDPYPSLFPSRAVVNKDGRLMQLETLSIAEPLQNRQHAQNP